MHVQLSKIVVGESRLLYLLHPTTDDSLGLSVRVEAASVKRGHSPLPSSVQYRNGFFFADDPVLVLAFSSIDLKSKRTRLTAHFGLPKLMAPIYQCRDSQSGLNQKSRQRLARWDSRCVGQNFLVAHI